MNRRFLILASLLTLPAVAAAQRTRTQADRHTDLFAKDSTRPTPTIHVRDIEDQSPIKLLIDKRKDLKLTDAQLSQLKDNEGKLKDKNAPLFKAVDSLTHDLRSPLGTPSDEDRARMRNARAGLINTIGEIHGNYDAAAKDAVASFEPDQQTKAAELLDKQKQDADKFLKERLGGRGGE